MTTENMENATANPMYRGTFVRTSEREAVTNKFRNYSNVPQ